MEEVWKDIPNYEGLYQVSNLGNVKSLQRLIVKKNYSFTTYDKILKKSKGTGGYLTVRLSKNKIGKNCKIHQLVAVAFLNHKPNGFECVVNHINHIREDNRLINLEIITFRENCYKKHLKTTSKYNGVSWFGRDNAWRSFISINGKNKYLGTFKKEIDASNAYNNALKQLS